jgi:hypothetical protein
MQPGRFTELFFLDEATAFAAGHRPCALCRRADYVRFRDVWADLHPGRVGADAIDTQLHAERVAADGRAQRRHEAALPQLPDGAFVLLEGGAWLVLGSELRRWTPGGYTERRRRAEHGQAVLLTPPSLVSVLGSGWESDVPLLHPSAGVRPTATARA